MIDTLIITHAIFGGVALVSGLFPIVSKKGGKLHRIMGKAFFYSMLVSVILSLVIALSPGHINPFLLGIGIFSLYLLIGGYLALQYKKQHFSEIPVWIISLLMIVVGLCMILIPIFITSKLNVILSVFALVGIVLSINDLRQLQNIKQLKSKYLTTHIGKITGAYIASFSAFLVVNDILPVYLNWFGPSIIGSVFIFYWIRKVTRNPIHPS